MIIEHNLLAMNSSRMLGITTKKQSKSTEKLSSGYKINRAADDAAGLAIKRTYAGVYKCARWYFLCADSRRCTE